MVKNNAVIFFIAFIAFSCQEHFESPNFERIYGLEHVYAGTDIIQKKDGGYAIIGETTAHDTQDLLFADLDEYGNVIHAMIIKGDSIDQGMDVIQTKDGGFLLTGQTSSFGNDFYDILLVKLDKSYKKEWSKVMGGFDNDYGNELIETSDNCYLLTGYTYSYGAGIDDTYLIKFSATGDTLWTKIYGGIFNDHSQSMTSMPDGGVALAGYQLDKEYGFYDIYVLRLDDLGDTLWTRKYGTEFHDRATAIYSLNDGSLIVGGGSEKSANDMDFNVLKLSPEGNVIWAKNYGTLSPEQLTGIAPAPNNGIYACGWTKGFDGSSDQMVLRLDANGKVIWTYVVGNEYDALTETCIQTNSGDVAVIGKSKEVENSPFKLKLMILDQNLKYKSCQERTVKIDQLDVKFHSIPSVSKGSRGFDIKNHELILKEVSIGSYNVCDK